MVKAIITKSLIEFNNKYIIVEDDNFDYIKVSHGLKLKPSDLSKYILSDILYAVNKDYEQVTTDFDLRSHIRESIITRDEILKKF